MPDHRFIFGALAAVVALLIIRALARWNDDEASPVSVSDLVIENGRLSKGAVVLMGAFAATTWFFLYYALTGRMTEGYFGLYIGAWITPAVARLITNGGGPAAAPAKP